MQDELVAVAADSINRCMSCGGCAEALHIAREVAAERRVCQKLFFGWIEAGDTEEREIGLTNQRRLAPEAHQFGGAASREMRNDHAIHAAGGSGGGSIEIRVAVHVNHADFAEIAACAGDGGERDGAVSCKNER